MIKILELILVSDFVVFLMIGVFHKNISKLCVAAGAAIYILLKIIQKKNIFWKNFLPNTPLNNAIFLFLGVSLVTVFFSQSFIHSQEIFVQRYILYFAAFFIAVFLSRNKKYTRVLIAAFLVGAVIVSIGGIWNILKEKNLVRLHVIYGINCLYSSYFVFAFSFFVYFIFFHPRKRTRLILIIPSLLVFICFLFNYSRAVWISFLISLFVIAFILNRNRWRVLVIFAVIVLVILMIPFFNARLFSKATLYPSTWGDRVPLWKAAVKIFLQYPIFGVGPGNYETLIYTIENPLSFSEGPIHLHAHSTYLEIMSEMGIFGLIGFLYIFIVFLKLSFKALKKNLEPHLFPFVISILSILIMDLTTSSIMVGLFPPTLFWFLLGMAVSLLPLPKNQNLDFKER